MSDYFGRVLGRTFAKPAITPRVRSRFEPEPGAGASELGLEIESEADISVSAEQAVEKSVSSTTRPPPPPDRARSVEAELRAPERQGVAVELELPGREEIARPLDSAPIEDSSEEVEDVDAPELAASVRSGALVSPRGPEIEAEEKEKEFLARPGVRPSEDRSSPSKPRRPSRATEEIARPMPSTRANNADNAEQQQVIERSTVRVTIGHLEIRSTAPEKKEREKEKSPPKQMLTLDEYVRERKEGRR
jgi:hypothetical protein